MSSQHVTLVEGADQGADCKSNAFTPMDRDEGTRKWIFYAFIGTIADALDVILTFVIPDKRPQRSIVVSKLCSLSLLHPIVLT
jgi:hypothetical protein